MEKLILSVIGAGVMGQGVGYQFAKFGYKVLLIDISDQALMTAKTKLNEMQRFDLLMQKMNKSPKGLLSEPVKNIEYSYHLKDAASSDIIIENIPEKFELKAKLYEELRNLLNDNCILGVNSSATSITRLASYVKHPENVLGIHFSNPVHLMPTVEMIRGAHTIENTIEKAKEILHSVQMNAVVINDWPGFVTNRVMLMMVNEAIFCLQDGVGKAEDIDAISEKCLSHPMGPLKLADLIGLDTILYSLEVLYDSLNDCKYRPSPLLRKMVDGNLLGRKTGRGFYSY